MCGPSYEQNWIPFTKECFVPSLVKILVLEKKIYNVVNVFLLFCYYFSFEKGVALHLNTRFPFTPKHLCNIWLKLAQWFWRRRFLNSVNIFSLLGKGVALQLNNLNPHHPKMLCTKFGWNWLRGSVEEENVKSLQLQQQQTTDILWSEKLWLRWPNNKCRQLRNSKNLHLV